MSEEWDDDVWDDPEPIVEVRKIDVDITTISKEELLTIEEAMMLCLDRKLEKLNLLLKMMNVYQAGSCLIANDRYNVVLDFVKTIEAFGMDIKQVNIAGLKGKTYLIGDIITKLLKIMGTSYDFSKVLEVQALPATVNLNGVQLFEYDSLNSTYDGELSSLLIEIRQRGLVRIQGTETLVDGVSQGIVSDQTRIRDKLKKYLGDIKKQACENNKKVQYGTTEILYTRARQMGYSVQKEVKGTQVQLVLVRVE